MKIINLNTNNIFDLPKSEAEKLLAELPDEFSKVLNKKKIAKTKQNATKPSTVLDMILDK